MSSYKEMDFVDLETWVYYLILGNMVPLMYKKWEK